MLLALARQSIAEVTELLFHKKEILQLLISDSQITVLPQIKLYIRDIQDHVVHMQHKLKVRMLKVGIQFFCSNRIRLAFGRDS